MANPSPSTSKSSSTRIVDLNEDSLAHCTNYLSLQDVSNLAMTCKSLKRVAYCDSVWQRFFRDHWPQESLSRSLQTSGLREAYLARRTALQQFKFVDPVVADFYTDARPIDHMLLDKDDTIIFSQGPFIEMVKNINFLSGNVSVVALNDHNARITCMRLFPLVETSLFRSESQRKENVLVTSSSDHSIRLWWKGSCQRCFRGHYGAVSTLSDKLLGDGSARLLASGGEDGTVRLWTLSSSGRRGQHALKATLYGHEKPVKLMSVAGHRTSLLASISTDSKVRVWDTTTSSSVRSSCCVGMTSVPGAPVDTKCHESLLYVAAGSSVVAIDLRTMQKVITAAVCPPKLISFDILPSKFLICTGGMGRALLWDIRRNKDTLKTEPMAEMDGHAGPLTLLHMDPYKIVMGGPRDNYISVWETDTGMKANSLMCFQPEGPDPYFGCAAMAVNGCRVVTAAYGEDQGLVRFRDFSNASAPIFMCEDEKASKFWGPQDYSDIECSDE